MLKCFLDIDGVLTDFPRAYNERSGLDIAMHDFAENRFAMTVGKSIHRIDAELDREFWATLPWMPRGRELLGLLEHYFGAANICLLSFPSYSIEGPTGKFDWVRDNLPGYVMRTILATDKRFCAGPGRVLFDDKARNVAEFREGGGHAVLVPAPWNEFECHWYECERDFGEMLAQSIWTGNFSQPVGI